MIKEAILKVVNGNDLNAEEAYEAMDEIMSGEASEVQMSAYLTALSMKGETIEDVVDILKLLDPSPPVPTISRTSSSFNSFTQCALIAFAEAVISSIVSPFIDKAVR